MVMFDSYVSLPEGTNSTKPGFVGKPQAVKAPVGGTGDNRSITGMIS